MSRALTRTNLLLESGKVQQLRKTLHSRSNSEAVRRVIEERLAVGTGVEFGGHHSAQNSALKDPSIFA